MNTDPLLVGVNSVFPNQNSSTAPTVWEEDTDQGAQQGIPSGSGPMLVLTKRSNNLAFLPGGAVNPAPEPNPQCLIVDNFRISPGGLQQLSASRLGSGLVGTASIGGTPPAGATPGARGLGVLGVGAPGDGVRGFALGPTPAGHGVAGETNSPNLSDAGVAGEAGRGGVGVKGESQRGSGIGVHGLGSNQAVRGEGGSFGVVGTGTATGVDGTGRFGIVGRATATGVDGAGTGPSSFGVVGVGGVAGVWGGNPTRGGIGVVGVSGPISGGIIPFAGRFTGPVMVAGPVTVFGPVSVTGAKSALIPHPDGSHRAMYAVEAPDSWFEDVGRAQLHQGVARVEIDPDFAAVSGLGDDYHVFLTPEGPSNGLYVTSRSPGGFEVREQGEGNAEISFSYRIMTPRTDIRTKRLEPIELPSETGVRATEPAEPPAVPSPDSPEEPGEAPPAELLPEGAVPEPPSDWPEAVPWPPDIMRNRDTR